MDACDLLVRRITCRDSREWVEWPPRRRLARSATVGARRPANDLYRRRARDWDPGFRMEVSLSGIKRADAGALALSLTSASIRRVVLRHPYSTPCRCSPAAPAWPLTGMRVNLPVSPPAPPACFPPPSLVLTITLAADPAPAPCRYLEKDVRYK